MPEQKLAFPIVRAGPTYYNTMDNVHRFGEALGDEGIYVWDGNYYALAVTQRLGVEEDGGMLRVGPVHYNTVEEIHRFGEVLRKIAANP